MRLWHKDLIPYLPRQQLLGQHRECCALRGKGWGKNHSVVNYVFEHPYSKLYAYHVKIMAEMKNRNYNVDSIWMNCKYRGKLLGYDLTEFADLTDVSDYTEHNEEYLQECIENLQNKGIYIKL